MTDIKAAREALAYAKKAIEMSAKGLPDRVSALKDLNLNEAEMLKMGNDKVAEVMKNVEKQMRSMNDFKNYKP